jgi:hypothetical protein
MVTVTRIGTGEAAGTGAYPGRMRVELPEGYVPPHPTHPLYGYLTPEELEEYEADERARVGIVPGVVEAAEEPAPMVSSWAPASVGVGDIGTESGPLPPPLSREEGGEAEEATVAHTGWVPSAPAEPIAEPATEPVALGASGEYRWDAYRQEWVVAAPAPAAVGEEEPPPDVAAAAGGRGASSSWTSADGSRYRWDARAQQWITEPPAEAGEESG